MQEIIIDVSELYKNENSAKLSMLDDYVAEAVSWAGNGNDVILTGAGPIWLYLKIAHALHGKARRLLYRSPATGDVVIFDHSPY